MRKPIEYERRGMQMPRERMWDAILKLRKGFTAWDVQDATQPVVGFDATRDYFVELETAGYIKRTGGGELTGHGARRTRPTFDLVKVSNTAPQLSRGKKVTQGTGVLAMWRAMKILRKGFSAQDLANAASIDGVFTVPRITADSYAHALAKAGYLAPLAKPKTGVATRWRLVRDSGPHAPAITKRKGVFDRNTGTFAELETAQEVCDGLE
ncbi:hypothetical protein [Variovorax gossypii]